MQPSPNYQKCWTIFSKIPDQEPRSCNSIHLRNITLLLLKCIHYEDSKQHLEREKEGPEGAFMKTQKDESATKNQKHLAFNKS